jgi:hypothetical protein
MKLSTLLRITAIVAVIQFIGHATLFITAVPTHGQEEVNLIEVMKSHLFNLGGFKLHSYWDLYFGYGLMAAFTVFIEAILFWLLSNIVKATPIVIRPTAALFILANIGHAILLWMYFSFLLPIAFDLIIIILLGLAFSKAVNLSEKQTKNEHQI